MALAGLESGARAGIHIWRPQFGTKEASPLSLCRVGSMAVTCHTSYIHLSSTHLENSSYARTTRTCSILDLFTVRRILDGGRAPSRACHNKREGCISTLLNLYNKLTFFSVILTKIKAWRCYSSCVSRGWPHLMKHAAWRVPGVLVESFVNPKSPHSSGSLHTHRTNTDRRSYCRTL